MQIFYLFAFVCCLSVATGHAMQSSRTIKTIVNLHGLLLCLASPLLSLLFVSFSFISWLFLRHVVCFLVPFTFAPLHFYLPIPPPPHPQTPHVWWPCLARKNTGTWNLPVPSRCSLLCGIEDLVVTNMRELFYFLR